MSEHYLVVDRDYDLLYRLGQYRMPTKQDAADCFMASVECSEAGGCGGWQECLEDHDGYDLDDEDSPAYDLQPDDEIEIHGVTHFVNHNYEIVIPFPGCVVQAHAGMMDIPDGIDTSRNGKYLLDVNWYYEQCYISMVREVTDE